MNHSAAIDLWSANKSRLKNFVRKRVKEKSSVEDIMQEVFIKLWTQTSTIKDKRKMLPWLFSVTRFTVADYFREKDRSAPLDAPERLADTGTMHSEAPHDESKKLLPIIHSLPTKYRTVLLMSDIHGIPHKEIAKQFDLTISCVKSRVVRARGLVAKKMHEYCAFSHDVYGNIIQCEEKKAYFDCLEKVKKEE